MIQTAADQNLDLQVAGLRILEARARLGIAVGQQYPQLQQARGAATRVSLSENAPNYNLSLEDNCTDYQVGFDAAWEPDFWGRYRRGIEAADTNPEGSRVIVRPKYLDVEMITVPAMALERVRFEIGHMGEAISGMISLLDEGFL